MPVSYPAQGLREHGYPWRRDTFKSDADSADGGRVSTSLPPSGMPEEPTAASATTAQPSVAAEKPARRSRLPRALLLLAGVVALVAIAFVAFGSSSNKTLDPVAQAATASANSPGVSIRMTMRISAPSQSTAITGQGSGRFDTRDRKGSMTLSLSTPRGAQTLQEVIDGTKVYIKLPSSLMRTLPLGGKQWVSLDLSKLGGIPGAGSLMSGPGGSDPTQMLQYLRAVSDSVVAQGNEQVNGLQTTRYHANIDLSRVAAALPASVRGAAQTAITALENQTHLTQLPIDVWVDTHHLVRRMAMSLRPSLPSGQTMNESFTIDFLSYAPQPAPQVPSSDEVTDLSKLIGAGP